jgi:hypothetical protein
MMMKKVKAIKRELSMVMENHSVKNEDMYKIKKELRKS